VIRGGERPVSAEQGIECATGNKILQNEITRTQTGFPTNFGGKLGFIPAFLFSLAPPLLLHIFTAPTCTITIITLEPCALNVSAFHAEIKNFLALWISLKEGTEGDFMDIFITLFI
jgi:hypothetical protein